MAQRKKIYQALDTHTVIVSRYIHCWFGSAHEKKKNVEHHHSYPLTFGFLTVISPSPDMTSVMKLFLVEGPCIISVHHDFWKKL